MDFKRDSDIDVLRELTPPIIHCISEDGQQPLYDAESLIKLLIDYGAHVHVDVVNSEAYFELSHLPSIPPLLNVSLDHNCSGDELTCSPPGQFGSDLKVPKSVKSMAHKNLCHFVTSSIEPHFLVSDILLSRGGNIEIQHFIDPYSDSIKSLKFINVTHPQELELSISEKGHFSMYSPYGKLYVDKPVIAAIVYEPPKNNSSQYPEMVYRQHIVYENVGKNTWMMSYIVTPNLYSIEKDIVQLSKDVQSEKFHFAANCIRLDIPTIESQDGWSVIPQSEKNYITQQQAYHFFISPTESDTPVISVLLRHKGNRNNDPLHVEVKVTGAKEDMTFFIQQFVA